MKKKLITYGVSGMMEFQAIIKIGRSVMKILFTDGSMNAMGTNPATYTTDNLMIQQAIERSEHFKRGRIHIVRSVALEDEVQIERNPKGKKVATPLPTPDAAGTGEANSAEVNSGESGSAESGAEGTSEEGEATAAECCKEIIEMEFDNNDDAKDFLESKFGYVRSKLRNRADIVAAGKAHDISISFS